MFTYIYMNKNKKCLPISIPIGIRIRSPWIVFECALYLSGGLVYLCPIEREEFKAKSMKIFIDYDVAYHIIPMLKFHPFTTGCKPNLQLHVYE